MPKSAKKRKDKAADFSKAKLKLGKGKQLASNAIDTSFKARSIALPSQSIAVEKNTTEPITKRRLTFDDLIAQIKHYNTGTRKDAILGLRELLESHWELLDSRITSLFNATARIISDEDAGVRKGLLAFYAWLLPQISPDDMLPHSSILLLFSTSAQTHIFPEIRVDAVRFLNLFLEYIPDTVVDGWNRGDKGHGSRVLEGYLGILNAGSKYGETGESLKPTSTASVVLTSSSKLVVFQSLSTFLQRALMQLGLIGNLPQSSLSSTPDFNSWFLEHSFTRSQAYASFEELLRPPSSQKNNQCHRPWQEEIEDNDSLDAFPNSYPHISPLTSYWGLQDLSSVVDASGKTSTANNARDPNVDFLVHLARTLHPTLLATFLDCAPNVFSPSENPAATEAQLILAIAEIARCLYGSTLQISVNIPATHLTDAQNLLGYMNPYFPFSLHGSRDLKLEQAFQNLNLIYCELTSLLITSSQTTGISSRRSKIRSLNQDLRNTSQSDALSDQTRRVSQYIVCLLQGAAGSSQISHSLSPVAYLALLPAIWALINIPGDIRQDAASDMIQAIVNHAVKTSSKSASKKNTIDFVARLVLLDTDPQYRGNFRPSRNVVTNELFEDWLLHLPQVLWELGAKNIPATDIILRALLRILQRCSSLINTKTVDSLRMRLVPFFSINHVVRGRLLGPYSKLPVGSPVRRLALDLAASTRIVGELDRNHSDDLSDAVHLAVVGTDEQSYWAHVKASY